MARKNPQRSVSLPNEITESLNIYAAQNHITVSDAIRQFIEQGLSVETYKKHQSEIRSYIREEIENTLSGVIKP